MPQAQQNILIMAHVFTRGLLLITFRTFHQNEFSHQTTTSYEKWAATPDYLTITKVGCGHSGKRQIPEVKHFRLASSAPPNPKCLPVQKLIGVSSTPPPSTTLTCYLNRQTYWCNVHHHSLLSKHTP